MASTFDLLLSMFIGIAIFGIIIAGSRNMSDEASFQRGETQAMESLLSTMSVLETDLRNIGSGVPDTFLVVRKAELAGIVFCETINRASGKIDTIEYTLGDPNELLRTQNPHDRYLYRKLNCEQPLRIGVVSEFALRYLTAASVELPLPVPSNRLSEISAIEMSLEVQGQNAIENAAGIKGPHQFPSARFSNRRFESKNLKR